MNKKVFEHGKKVVVYVARKVAERDANTSCPFYGYQERLPKAVKKLKKS